MNNKKGFTLVELLAVIAILSLLVIIALPNIVSLFKEAKNNSFMNECKEIYKTAQQQWMSDSMFETNERIYIRCSTCTGVRLPMSGRKEIDYFIKLNKAGKIVEFYVTDGTYQYSYKDEDLKIEDINGAVEIAGLLDEDKIIITDEMASNIATFCVNWGDNVSNYEYEKGMTWGSYINSFYNTTFDEHHDHNINRGFVSTISGSTSYCGYDMKYNNDNVPITSAIHSSSEGCYVYKHAGIC